MTLGTGLQLSKAEPGPDSYDISPDGAEIAFAADTDTTGVAPQPRHPSGPGRRGPARNITKDNPADDIAPLYSPDGRVLAFGRQMIRDFYADRVRLVLPRPRHGRQSHRHRPVGSLGERPGVDARQRVAAGRHRRCGAVEGVPDRRGHGEAGGADDRAERAGDRAVARRQDGGGAPRRVLGAAHARAAGSVGRHAGEDLHVQRRAAGARGVGALRERDLQGLGRRRHPDVGGLPAGLRPDEEVSRSTCCCTVARTTACRILHVPLERPGVLGLGLRDGVAQLPRVDRASGRPSPTRSPATGRPGRTRTRLRRPRGWPAQPWADKDRMAAGGGSYGGYLATLLLGRPHPFKTLDRPRSRLQPLHAVRLGRRRRAQAVRRVLGPEAGRALPQDVAALRRGELHHAHAGDSRGARLPRPRQPRHRGLQRAAEPRRAQPAHPLPQREPLDSQAAELALLVRSTREWLREFIGAGVAPPAAGAGPLQFTTPLGRAVHANGR